MAPFATLLGTATRSSGPAERLHRRLPRDRATPIAGPLPVARPDRRVPDGGHGDELLLPVPVAGRQGDPGRPAGHVGGATAGSSTSPSTRTSWRSWPTTRRPQVSCSPAITGRTTTSPTSTPLLQYAPRYTDDGEALGALIQAGTHDLRGTDLEPIQRRVARDHPGGAGRTMNVLRRQAPNRHSSRSSTTTFRTSSTWRRNAAEPRPVRRPARRDIGDLTYEQGHDYLKTLVGDDVMRADATADRRRSRAATTSTRPPTRATRATPTAPARCRRWACWRPPTPTSTARRPRTP